MTDQRIDKWTRWINGPIKNAVLAMHHHRRIYEELADVIHRRFSREAPVDDAADQLSLPH